MSQHDHRYRARLAWRGNTGEGTRRYDGYARTYEIAIDGKPVLQGSADASFRGDARLHNPEDLLLAAIAGCHMLSYLALCARQRVNVLAYTDSAEGTMRTDPDGSGRFTRVLLRPRVLIGDAAKQALAVALHERAHRLCFIANSCNFPIANEPEVRIAGGDDDRGGDEGIGDDTGTTAGDMR